MVYEKLYTDMLRSRLKGKTYCSYGTVEKDLMKGADPNQFDLVLKKNKDLSGLTKLFLEYGADPNKRYSRTLIGKTVPVLMAIESRQHEALQALANDPRCDLDIKITYMMTPYASPQKLPMADYARKLKDEKTAQIIDKATEKRRRQKAAKDALQQKDTRKFRLKI